MIALQPLNHGGALCIKIDGRVSTEVYSGLRRMHGCRYSKTHRCLYFVYTCDTLDCVIRLLQRMEVEYRVSRVAFIEEKRTDSKNIEIPAAYEEHLLRMRYSTATRVNYCIQFRNFLAYHYPKKADSVTEQDIHGYMTYLVRERGVSLSTQNQAINAIKFYLEHVMAGERKVYYCERPRSQVKLPVVLGEEEIARLFSQITNVKHKCMIMLLYSSGLRISELLALKQDGIDAERGLIHVHGGKGKKTG